MSVKQNTSKARQAGTAQRQGSSEGAVVILKTDYWHHNTADRAAAVCRLQAEEEPVHREAAPSQVHQMRQRTGNYSSAGESALACYTQDGLGHD